MPRIPQNNNQKINRQIEAFSDQINYFVKEAFAHIRVQNAMEAAKCAPFILNEIDHFESFVRYAVTHFKLHENENRASYLKFTAILEDINNLREEVQAHAHQHDASFKKATPNKISRSESYDESLVEQVENTLAKPITAV